MREEVGQMEMLKLVRSSGKPRVKDLLLTLKNQQTRKHIQTK